MDEKDLKKLAQEQLIIFDSIPAWIFYKNKNNTFMRVNQAFCTAMGKNKSELEGKSLYDFYPKDLADAYLQDDLEVIQSGQAKTNIIEQVKTPSGMRWVKTDKIPYRDNNGEIIGVIGFTIDITDQKNSEIMLQKIIDLLPTRIFWKDLNLKYLGCNKAFAKDAGKTSPEDLIGKDDFQMGWKDQAELYQADDRKVIESKTSKLNYDEEQTTPSGEKIWLNTNKVPLTNDNGEIIGVLGTYIDITENKLAAIRLEKALEETERMNVAMVGRELKMIELKKQLNQEAKNKN